MSNDRRSTPAFGYPELARRDELKDWVERDERAHEQILDRVDRVETKCDVMAEHLSTLRAESAVTSTQVARVLVILEGDERQLALDRAHRRRRALQVIKIVGGVLVAIAGGIAALIAKG